MRAAFLVCAMAGSAVAGPRDPDQAKQQARAEALEAKAKETKDFDAYVAAGTAYLDIYNADPKTIIGDELLYNAAVMFEEGHANAVAIQTFILLQRQYPASKITVRATARLGKLYGDLAMYDKAAEQLEQYAKKYASERDAYAAMSDAVFYRKALGDREKAIEDTKYFVRTFGTKEPADAANAMWSLTALYEDNPDSAVKHLREYLHVFGSKGGPERVVIAHAQIGEILWKQSCRGPTFDGLCVTSNEAAQRTCGTGTTHTLVPRTRKATTSKAALAEFKLAIEKYERGPRVDDQIARYYYAQAKLAQGDADLEAYLALALPTGLDLASKDREKWRASAKRFDAWLADKMKAAEAVRSQTNAVFAIKDVASSVTAAEREGLIVMSLASLLATAEIPRDVRRAGPDEVTGFCDRLVEVAEPLEAKMLMDFGVCLQKSTELSWWADSSAVCERELIRLRPREYPELKEHFARPVDFAPVIASEPPLVRD